MHAVSQHRRGMRPGFSLMELIIVVTIIAIISSVGIPLFAVYQSRSDLYTSVNEMTQALNRAKLLAENGKNGTAWGVNVPNGVLFSGNSYATRNVAMDELYEMPLTITASGITEVVFSQLHGTPNLTGSVVLINDNDEQGVIQISSLGVATLGNDILNICMHGVLEKVPDALWPYYKSQGAISGACPTGPDQYTCWNTKGPVTVGAILLDGSDNHVLRITGNGGLTTSGAVVINSTDSAAAMINGTGNAAVETLYIVGTPGIQESGGGTFSGLQCIPSPARPNPYAGMAPPTPPVISYGAQNINGNSVVTLYPGEYVGGIQVSNNAVVTLDPGIYYLNGGGLEIQNDARVTGDGVLIYNAPTSNGDKITLKNQGVLTVSPLADGSYGSVAIFQDPASDNDIEILNNAYIDVAGAVYASGATLDIGSDFNSLMRLFVGRQISISGNGSLILQ